MMKVLVYVRDLFFRVKIEDILKKISRIDFESAEESLDVDEFGDNPNFEKFDYIILNLEQDNNMQILEKYPDKIICFCSHIKTELIGRAKDMGCKHVYPRSVFFAKLHEICKTSV